MSRPKRQSKSSRSVTPPATNISSYRDRDALLVLIVLPLTTFWILCYELSEERIRQLAVEVPRRSLNTLWLPGEAAIQQFQALADNGAEAFVRTAIINLAADRR